MYFFRFYALTAAAALLRYVEYIQCIVFQPHSLKIEYHASENSTFIGKSILLKHLISSVPQQKKSEEKERTYYLTSCILFSHGLLISSSFPYSIPVDKARNFGFHLTQTLLCLVFCCCDFTYYDSYMLA